MDDAAKRAESLGDEFERHNGDVHIEVWRSEIAAAIRDAVYTNSLRWIKAVCPFCGPNHLLDNGRVWGMCGCQRLIAGGFPEEEIAELIRKREAQGQ